MECQLPCFVFVFDSVMNIVIFAYAYKWQFAEWKEMHFESVESSTVADKILLLFSSKTKIKIKLNFLFFDYEKNWKKKAYKIAQREQVKCNHKQKQSIIIQISLHSVCGRLQNTPRSVSLHFIQYLIKKTNFL